MFKIQKGLLESTDPLKFVNDLSNEAVGVYTKLGLWSAVKGLDGVVTFEAMDDVKVSEEAQDELLDAGLLVLGDSHFQITGWEEHQTTAAQLAARAEGTRERMRKLRERRAGKVVTPSQVDEKQDVTPSPAEVTPSHGSVEKNVTASPKESEDVTPSHDEEEVLDAATNEEYILLIPNTDAASSEIKSTATVVIEDAEYGPDEDDEDFAEDELEEFGLTPVDEEVGVASRRRDFTRGPEPRMTQTLQSFDDKEIDLLLHTLEDFYPGLAEGSRLESAFRRVIRTHDAEDVITAAKQFDKRSPEAWARRDFPDLKDWLRGEHYLEEKVFAARQ